MTDKGEMNDMPDAKDGYVGDKNADDGVIDDIQPSPSPNVTKKR